MSTALKIENVSKKYRLGEVGTGTLSHDLHRTWAKLRGKPDPFAKVGEVNNREQQGGDYAWALKDIDFKVEQGEILGIIGRNGAGKSTLLKLLSRVTAPTTGKIKTRGRIASLLEVGTGFHPELTGRENVYLNGAIMGMTRSEIAKRIDEIVDFSGCAKYIDTPVKRYSSGMTVRLGFSVAAHLDCETLIVDEVLAVGDADFQKKCIAKMQDVAGHGRTVLFVSHNMVSVSRLTEKCIVLQDGEIFQKGSTSAVIEQYLRSSRIKSATSDDISEAPRLPGINRAASLTRLAIVKLSPSFRLHEAIRVRAVVRGNQRVANLYFHLTIFTEAADPVGTACSEEAFCVDLGEERELFIDLPRPSLAPGRYYCDVAILDGPSTDPSKAMDIVPNVLHFSVEPRHLDSESVARWHGAWGNVILPDMKISQTTPRDSEASPAI